MFQSRNRDAFLFKSVPAYSQSSDSTVSFNLVIEMLFFSSRYTEPLCDNTNRMFQSRNRDAFLFKLRRFLMSSTIPIGFNLVIEMLFFSSDVPGAPEAPFLLFQSRNRDAFLFKPQADDPYFSVISFQSRNRDAFLFKDIRHLSSWKLITIEWFQSRNRDAFLFKPEQWEPANVRQLDLPRFNLVIEMLFFSSLQ